MQSVGMPEPRPGPRLGKASRNWLLFGAVAIGVLAVSFAATLWTERRSTLIETQQSAEKLALALEEHTAAVFNGIDAVLSISQREIEREMALGHDDAIRAILERNAVNNSAIDGLGVRDADGRLIYLSVASQRAPTDAATSDYVRAHRDDAAAGLYIGSPIRGAVSGEWLIPISRRLNRPGGAFAGVVVAAVPLRFFSDFFRALKIGDGALVTLLRTDGTTLVREPAHELIGQRVEGSPLFTTYLPQAPTGTLRLASIVDGIDRLFAYRSVPRYPLVVTVGISVGDALEEWNYDLRVDLLIWLLCATVLAAFTTLMVRQAARHDAAEHRARVANSRFQRLVDNIPGGVFQRVLRTDGGLGFNFLSENTERIFGHSPDELIRDPSMFTAAIHADDRPKFEEAVRVSARGLTTMSVEYRVCRPDGSLRWARAVSTPTRLPSGEIIWDGVVLDVSEQKEMENALRKSEAEAAKARTLLTDAIESINGGFVLYDAEDRLVMMNRASREWKREFTDLAVPGITHAELIRAAVRTGWVIGPGEKPEDVIDQRLALHRRAYGQPIECCVDGRWYQVTEHPTSDGGVVVLRTEITELKKANLRLEEARAQADDASRAKSEFLAMMSHELRTPLNAILGFAEVIRDHGDRLQRPKIREYAGDIHASGSHLLTLINDVLDLSKAESGRMELQPGPLNVADVIERSLRMMKERALQQNVALVQAVAPDLPTLWADERKLMQVLLNLLSNAVKFTPAGGRVTISARHAADLVTITIADTGIGIAKENIEKALAAFGQVDSLLTRQHAGTGLGLPLAKRLTELHGAVFDLQSEVGTGTTVTLRFPVVQRENSSVDETAKAAQSSPTESLRALGA
jgi:PAS domain S-box-containing protein